MLLGEKLVKSLRISSFICLVASTCSLSLSTLSTLAYAGPGSTPASESPNMAWSTFRNGLQNQGVSPIALRPFLKAQNNAGEVQKFQTGGLVWATPVSDSEGNTYVGAANKIFYSFTSSGQLRWTYTLLDRSDSLIDSAAALPANSNLVVVPGGDGYLHALDRTTGQLQWRFQAHHVPPEKHQEGTIVNSFEGNVQSGKDGVLYAGSDNQHLYAVNPDGTEAWAFPTGMMIWSSPAFSPDNQWMTFGSLDGNLYLLDPHHVTVDPKDGSKMPKLLAMMQTGNSLLNPGNSIKASPVVDNDGNIYFGTSNREFFSVRVEKSADGSTYRLEKNWSFQTKDEIYSSAALKDGKIVFTSLDGNLYCLDKQGKLLWKYTVYSRISSSPLISQDGVVLFGAKNGKLYAVNLENGTRIWSYRTTNTTEKSNLDSSPSVDLAGNIHVGSYNGNLYSIPYAYCQKNPKDQNCEFGKTFDLPEYARNIETNQATLSVVSSPVTELSSPIRLQLVAFEDGELIDRAAIDATPSKISVVMTPSAEVEVQVSSDGKYLNLLPKTFLKPDTEYRIQIKGEYFKKTYSWLGDRLQMFNHKPFEANQLRVKTVPQEASVLNQPTPSSHYTWGLKSLYLFQPEALDTYTPAALDGQAFLVTAFGFNPEKNNKVMILGLPAFADQDGFKAVPETSKVFTLNGSYENGELRGIGSLKLSGMGGEIPMDTFHFTLAPKPGSQEFFTGQFDATASCTKIKGNGSTYKFPDSLVNQICDYALRMIGVGSFQAQLMTQNTIKNPLSGDLIHTEIESSEKQVRLRLHLPHDVAVQDGHLITLVQYDAQKSEILTHETTLLNPKDINANGEWEHSFNIPSSRECFRNRHEPLETGPQVQFFLDSEPLTQPSLKMSQPIMQQAVQQNFE